MATVYKCDFCCSAEPVHMYAHPEIRSRILRLTWNAGHCGACPACGELLEGGNIDQLADRVLGLLAPYRFEVSAGLRDLSLLEKMASKLIQGELMRFYEQISRQREPFEPPEVYNAKRA